MGDSNDNFSLWPLGHPTVAATAPAASVAPDAARSTGRSTVPSGSAGSASDRAALAEWEGEGGHLAAPQSPPSNVS